MHVAREDLGVEGRDQDRISRYAQRIAQNRQRQVSTRSAVDWTLKLAVDLPDRPTPLDSPSAGEAPQPSESSHEAPVGQTHDQEPAREDHILKGQLVQSELFMRALGPLPQERVAHERWEREARRLQALRANARAGHSPHPVGSAHSRAEISAAAAQPG